MTVTLFSRIGCTLCFAAEKRMSNKGIEFQKEIVEEDSERWAELQAEGHASFPVIRAEKAGQKVLEFAGFSDERINQLSNLIKAS